MGPDDVTAKSHDFFNYYNFPHGNTPRKNTKKKKWRCVLTMRHKNNIFFERLHISRSVSQLITYSAAGQYGTGRREREERKEGKEEE